MTTISGGVSNNLGLYVHLPFCKSRCAYCNFVSGCDMSRCDEYALALADEIKSRASGEKVDTVYIGGGTPSVLPKGNISKIFSAIYENFCVEKNAEITVECNPDSASDDFFSECADCGVNRISVGLQSTSDELLKKVARPHNYEQFLSAIDRARKRGLDNIGADLMIGLPDQTLFAAKSAVKAVIELGLKHISLYGLSVEEGTPLFKSGYRPDEDLCADMYASCVEELFRGGFYRYEVSNFAFCGYHSRHNMKYWTGAPYMGFGLAAHSFDGNARYANTESLSDYLGGATQAEKTVLSENDKREETIMLSLRTANGLSLSKLKENFGCDLLAEKRTEIARLIDRNLIAVDGDRLALTESAFYIMNSIIVALI